MMNEQLNGYLRVVNESLAQLKQNNIVQRIWEHDHTVWKPEPTEIDNRLGWLGIVAEMQAQIGRMQALAADVKGDGFTDVLLLGMGGSSMAPELFAKTFGAESDGLNLQVLDSTDADTVQAKAAHLDLSKTLFIVATKSGGTVETLSFFKYFYNRTAKLVGDAGAHFVAITDPGSKLETLAQEHAFRAVFLNNPNIGGRYSVLSYFGLVPAALVGLDVVTLLDRAATAVTQSQSVQSEAIRLGVIMGELAKAGRDKVTFILSPALASFGDWVEQLIAESTGKDGVGILPVVGESVGAPDVYGADRLFIYLRLPGDVTHDVAFEALAAAGHPTVTFDLQDKYDVGGQFFLWEMATAVAGYCLQIQPFDQPNVEAAKILARGMVAAYMEEGELPPIESSPVTAVTLQNFMSQAQPGDYVAIQAYIPPTAETDTALSNLRTYLRDTYQLATTVGYGPRFLHSTGQLHKGDDGNGLFIQLTSDAVTDAPIPDEAGLPEATMTFGVLKMAQALGDGQALLDADRRMIRFHLGQEVADGFKQLLAK